LIDAFTPFVEKRQAEKSALSTATPDTTVIASSKKKK